MGEEGLRRAVPDPDNRKKGVHSFPSAPAVRHLKGKECGSSLTFCPRLAKKGGLCIEKRWRKEKKEEHQSFLIFSFAGKGRWRKAPIVGKGPGKKKPMRATPVLALTSAELKKKESGENKKAAIEILDDRVKETRVALNSTVSRKKQKSKENLYRRSAKRRRASDREGWRIKNRVSPRCTAVLNRAYRWVARAKKKLFKTPNRKDKNRSPAPAPGKKKDARSSPIRSGRKGVKKEEKAMTPTQAHAKEDRRLPRRLSSHVPQTIEEDPRTRSFGFTLKSPPRLLRTY